MFSHAKRQSSWEHKLHCFLNSCILVEKLFLARFHVEDVRKLCIAMEHYSSLCVSAVVLILGGFDIMEVDVQDREQVDSGEK